MMKDSPGFLFIRQKLSNVSEGKIKEGILVGPQIGLVKDTYKSILNNVEGAPSALFKEVSKHLKKKTKTDNYQDIVVCTSYRAKGM